MKEKEPEGKIIFIPSIEVKDLKSLKIMKKKIIKIETDPRIIPLKYKITPNVTIVDLPHGYGLMWTRCKGEWCWYPPTMCGPEGNSPPQDNGVNKFAKMGALVGRYYHNENSTTYLLQYERKYDSSEIGTRYYKNNYGFTLRYQFFINDVMHKWIDNFKDNLGHMNSDIEIFRL